MNCPKCQTENAENTQVCQSCGSSLTAAATPTAILDNTHGCGMIYGVTEKPALGTEGYGGGMPI